MPWRARPGQVLPWVNGAREFCSAEEEPRGQRGSNRKLSRTKGGGRSILRMIITAAIMGWELCADAYVHL